MYSSANGAGRVALQSRVTVRGCRIRPTFAGEATDTSGQASTVAGAISSGQRAARQLLAGL
jgi:monoamine oxidase